MKFIKPFESLLRASFISSSPFCRVIRLCFLVGWERDEFADSFCDDEIFDFSDVVNEVLKKVVEDDNDDDRS